MNIEGKYITLRAMTRDDANFVVDIFNDKNIEVMVGGIAFPLSADQHLKWYENNIDSSDRRLIIEHPQYGRLGIARMSSPDWRNGSAIIGLKMISGETRGKGFGKDVVMSLLRWGFDELRLHRINVTYLECNEISRNMHLRCGFTEEGKIRECIYQGGKWENLIFAGILRDEYYSMIKKTGYWDDEKV